MTTKFFSCSISVVSIDGIPAVLHFSFISIVPLVCTNKVNSDTWLLGNKDVLHNRVFMWVVVIMCGCSCLLIVVRITSVEWVRILVSRRRISVWSGCNRAVISILYDERLPHTHALGDVNYVLSTTMLNRIASAHNVWATSKKKRSTAVSCIIFILL